MSLGAEELTRHEAFDENDLQRLRTEAARMVADGILTLEDVSLDGQLDEDQDLADGENEAFREAVADDLDDVPERDPTSTPSAADSDTGAGWSAEEVDFRTIWHEFNFNKTVSRTQLEGALEVSDHTNLGGNTADTAIQHGVETGQLADIPREMAALGSDETETKTGVLYARGWSE